MAKLKLTQKKSVIGRPEDQKRTVRALGLKRINDSAVHEDKPEIKGMINKVRHLLEVEEIKSEARNPKSETISNNKI